VHAEKLEDEKLDEDDEEVQYVFQYLNEALKIVLLNSVFQFERLPQGYSLCLEKQHREKQLFQIH